jgi:hypothetical protein
MGDADEVARARVEAPLTAPTLRTRAAAALALPLGGVAGFARDPVVTCPCVRLK